MTTVPVFMPGAVVTSAQLNALAALAANNGQTTQVVMATGSSYASAPICDSNFNFATQATNNQAGMAFTQQVTGIVKRYLNRTAYDLLLWPPNQVTINAAQAGEPLLFGPGRTIWLFQTGANTSLAWLA